MRLRLLLFALLSLTSTSMAMESSFLVADTATGQVLWTNGTDTSLPHSPCSTFKIALSLMGYDAGILVNDTTPEWPYEGEWALFDSWKEPQTPQTWMTRSVLWYSQRLTQRLGMDTILRYLQLFAYGNQDMTGDPGLDNGLTHAWLSSSLQISPEEQVSFLSRLVRGDLPVSPHACQMTRHLICQGELEGGWTLFAKTGTDLERRADGSRDPNRKLMWIVGWVERDQQAYAFALFLRDTDQCLSKEDRKEIAIGYLRQAAILP